MKRYRVFLFDFNSTGDLLRNEINDEWEENVKALHRDNRKRIIEELTQQYGQVGIDQKLDNLRAIGGQAFSIVAYHNRFYRQAREAFIVGAYYPALTAACALGERILNHLVLELRNEYTASLSYKKVHSKKSIDNWKIMIDALEEWDVLLPEVTTALRNLKRIRDYSIHFNPDVVERDRELAVDALKHLDEIIQVQFGILGNQPWFIPDVAGAAYIRREWESNPFVKLVYLPASLPVGPFHWMEFNNGQWTIFDQDDYENREISDAEYCQLVEEFTQKRIADLPKQGTASE